MPFQSYEQMSWMKHNKPKMYKKWIAKYGKKIVGSKKENKYTSALKG